MCSRCVPFTLMQETAEKVALVSLDLGAYGKSSNTTCGSWIAEAYLEKQSGSFISSLQPHRE